MLRTHHPLQESLTGYYLASIVEYFFDKDSNERVNVWESTILIQAQSPKNAIEEAIRIGKSKEREYRAEGDWTCLTRFGGVTRLSPIRNNLESGSEVDWLDLTGIDETVLAKRIAGVELEEVYSTFDQISEDDGEYPPPESISCEHGAGVKRVPR